MEAGVQKKVEQILRGELRYTSSNLALNMLISKMQKRIQADPGSMSACIDELDLFIAKYPIVAKVDLANIAAL
ncbi:MAG: hypothetical protein K6B14_10835 [Lachnospiraceae bacterium]|nr:hypothetical protein [Lachnospiraceae bacterium]